MNHISTSDRVESTRHITAQPQGTHTRPGWGLKFGHGLSKPPGRGGLDSLPDGNLYSTRSRYISTFYINPSPHPPPPAHGLNRLLIAHPNSVPHSTHSPMSNH